MNNLIINALQNSINFALNQDPQKSHILELTKYKKLQVIITDWNMQCIFSPEKNSITVIEKLEPEITPDCILSGKLFDLISLSFSDNAQRVIQAKKVEQTGDLHVLQDYQAAIKAFKVDLPEQIKNTLGPSLTQIFISPVKSITSWLSGSFNSTKKDVKEYAQEESNFIPPTEEVKDFFDDVQELSLKLDRLNAQITEYKTLAIIKGNA